jgi:hypothetical protein
MKSYFALGETVLDGYFADGPDRRVHVESDRIGNCRLVTYSPTTCTPTCTDMDLCIAGVCESPPTRVDRGVLRWVWPDGKQTIEPNELLAYYATGAASARGDASITVDGITLKAPTVDSPKPERDLAEVLRNRKPGEDATLRWTNTVTNARVRFHMTDCTGSHGRFAVAEIECEGPDTGELVVPGTFVNTVEAGDWSRGECGVHRFERYFSATPPGDDSVRFETVGDARFFYFPGRSWLSRTLATHVAEYDYSASGSLASSSLKSRFQGFQRSLNR